MTFYSGQTHLTVGKIDGVWHYAISQGWIGKDKKGTFPAKAYRSYLEIARQALIATKWPMALLNVYDKENSVVALYKSAPQQYDAKYVRVKK